MGVSKVIYGDTPVMDITDSTVTPQNLLSGEVAYSASGNRVVGEVVTTTVVANPSETPTDELTAIQIGETVYSVSSGGGGGTGSGKTLVKKTKTYTGDGQIPLVVTFDEKPLLVYSIYGPGLNESNTVRMYPFVYGETKASGRYINNDNSSGNIGYTIAYSNNDLTMSVTSNPQDAGACLNNNESSFTITYLVEENTSGGHTILNDDGTALPAEPNLQFKGIYTHDDSTNEATVAEITRVMTSADYNLLSEDEKQGVIVITDEDPDPVYIDVTGTLTAGQTTITLGSTAITPTSTSEIFTDAPDVDYNTKELIYTPSVLEYTVHFTTVSSKIAVTLKDGEGTQISQNIIAYYEANGESNAFVLDGLVKLWYDQPTWKIRTLRVCTSDNIDYNINDIVKTWDYTDSANFDVDYYALSWAIRLTYDARQTDLGVKVRVS